MKFVYIIFLSLFTIACSGDNEETQTPKKNTTTIEKKSVQPLSNPAKPSNDRISGSGAPRISGAPSSSHFSGQ